MTDDVDAALTHLARHSSGRILSLLATRFGDVEIADDAVQEAMIEAARRWPVDGIPDNPAGWLHQVSRRKAIDHIRRETSARRRVQAAAPDLLVSDDSPIEVQPMIAEDETVEVDDERLRLILLCCHPALNPDAQVALTLRLVGGLTTEEIAAAFLIPTPTLAQRISRAKKKIRTANIPMSMPEHLDDRLGVVATVLYLAFNEGYLSRSPTAEAMRLDLCEEALRLVELMCGLAPQNAEIHGLLALVRFTHARRNARTDGDELVLLDRQDRTVWYSEEIAAGNEALAKAMKMMQPGVFQLQALIAAQHANARTAADTDWPKIAALYDQLMAMRPSPVVALNRAAAIAMADGPLAGLKLVDEIEGLDRYHLFHATRAELLTRAGRADEAVEALTKAQQCVHNAAENRLLVGRSARLQQNRTTH